MPHLPSSRSHRRALALVGAIALLLSPGSRTASASDPAASATSDGDSAAKAARAPLPKLAPLVPPEATIDATKELQRILDLLTSSDEKTRESGKAALAEVNPAMVGAVRQRVSEIRTSLDREEAPRMLDDIRRAGRKARKGQAEPKPDKKADKGDKKGDKKGDGKEKTAKAEREAKPRADDDGGDWLDFLVESPRPKDRTWRHLIELVGMNRVLANIGTTPAVRELVAMHTYFGDLLRVDVQRLVQKLRDKAVPALIEARQHDAKMIQRWASRQLDQLGKAIPGEAVSTSDTQVIADVLRAYGRTRDVDAVRVMLSFSNSERIELREAAREAVGTIGEPANWQLREAYLSMTGQKPPRDWSWDRVARELFSSFDKARLAEVYKAMDEGLALAKKGEHEEAAAFFDRVLARAPLFERRREMVPTYLALGEAAAKREERKTALEYYRKALRLDGPAPGASGAAASAGAGASKKLSAEIAYLEALELAAEGRPDKFLLERVLELDPGHRGAADAIASLGVRAVERQSRARSYAAAGAIGVIALAAMLVLWRGRRSPRVVAAVPPPGPLPPGGGERGSVPPPGAPTEGADPRPGTPLEGSAAGTESAGSTPPPSPERSPEPAGAGGPAGPASVSASGLLAQSDSPGPTSVAPATEASPGQSRPAPGPPAEAHAPDPAPTASAADVTEPGEREPS